MRVHFSKTEMLNVYPRALATSTYFCSQLNMHDDKYDELLGPLTELITRIQE